MIYYVSANYKYIGNGTKEKPFQTITEAAQIAIAGDIVKVRKAYYILFRSKIGSNYNWCGASKKLDSL